MNAREATARAMAFFETTDDLGLLHQLTGEVAPRARRMVGTLVARAGEDDIPPPADLHPAREAASRDEAVETLRRATDFALLQALARSIGRRLEAMEIAASAEFPVGARVTVPERGAYPPAGRRLPGTVEVSGTELEVVLDDGETWRGPASLVQLRREP